MAKQLGQYQINEAVEYVEKALLALQLHPEFDDQLDVEELDLPNSAERIVSMWLELTNGLHVEAPTVSEFKSDHNEMLFLRDIEFVSVCSHHLAPFRGKAHIAYIPRDYVVGLSKPARIVDYFASRPQTQELMTRQIADWLEVKLRPRGVMVVIEAEHTCVSSRGVRKSGSTFTTSTVRGVFLEDPSAKLEALALLKGKI